jgi:hypothetical protein
MDPVTAFGLATNIFQVTQLAFDILYNSICFYRNVRDAEVRSRQLRQELDTLVDLLFDTQDVINRTPTLEVPQSIQNEIETMLILLRQFYDRIKPKETSGIRKLTWPLKREENERIIREINRFKGTLNALLNIRQTY